MLLFRICSTEGADNSVNRDAVSIFGHGHGLKNLGSVADSSIYSTARTATECDPEVSNSKSVRS